MTKNIFGNKQIFIMGRKFMVKRIGNGAVWPRLQRLQLWCWASWAAGGAQSTAQGNTEPVNLSVWTYYNGDQLESQ